MPDTVSSQKTKIAWWTSGLFWRTFFLLGFLIVVSMATWIASFRIIERDPNARQTAAQITSVITITRSALTHSAPELRQALLLELANSEGIRIYPLEAGDRIEPPPEGGFMKTLHQALKKQLGEGTRLSREVNNIPGFWVSFKIDDDDEYWIVMNRSRWERVSNLQWIGWAAAVLILSLLGAGFISGFVNQPLARLAVAARTLANGQTPAPLPEAGTAEIRDANHSFNQMVQDLANVELERVEILAGISHDLRTPLTRMQLELEMASLSHEAKEGMQTDIQQMDAIVGQFLDYARLGKTAYLESVNLSLLLERIVEDQSRKPDVHIQSQLERDLFIQANETDLRRMLDNLFANALLYGKKEGVEIVEIDVHCAHAGDEIIIQIADHGVGIPEESKNRMLRPFTRIDDARSQANGSGLGLAIVERIVKRYGGKIQLKDRDGGGLLVVISFPAIG